MTVNQKRIIKVEMYNKELDRYIRSDHVIISRNKYNSVTT